MGILDEAIREHLALKRRQGLSDDELKRLEDEAFGPPSRPGEPDFPDQAEDRGEEAPEQPGGPSGDDGDATLQAASGQPSVEDEAVEPIDTADEETALFESSPAEEDEAEPEPGPEASEAIGPRTEEFEAPAYRDSAQSDAEDLPAAGHPAEADAEPGAELFDEDRGDADTEAGELDLDVNLDVDDEGGAVESEGAAQAEPAIESLETVEHRIEEEAGVEEQLEEPPLDEDDFDDFDDFEVELDDELEEELSGEGGEDDAESESVLEDTPDFLRDAPEDDELWFEQGEPKDFDF